LPQNKNTLQRKTTDIKTPLEHYFMDQRQ